MWTIGLGLGLQRSGSLDPTGPVYGIVLSSNTATDSDTVGTVVGTAEIVGTVTGTPVWSLTNSAGGKYAINSSTGAITVAAALTSGTDIIAVAVAGTTPAIPSNTFGIVVAAAGSAPVSTANPTISGTAQSGQTLTVTQGTWTGSPAPTLTDQWQRDGVDIAGATGLTYTQTDTDVGHTIDVVETATNTYGSASATSSSVGPVAAAAGGTPSSPTLTLTSAANDNTPNFDVGIPVDAIAGDVLRIEHDGGSGYATYLAHTITSGDITSGTISETATALPDGSYNYRARMERGTNFSAYSSVVSGPIDTTAPVLSSPTATSSSATLASISVATDTPSGTMDWFVDTTATAPADNTAFDTRRGAAPASAVGAAVTTSPFTASVTGLTGSTTYYTYFRETDAAGNKSAIAAAASFTTASGVFDPSALFPASGAYFNVAKAVADGKIYKADGVTVAAVGDPVGKLWDYSGNNNHVLNTTSTKCPILHNSGSQYWLEFDGVDDYLAAAFSLPAPKTIVSSLAQVSWTNADFIFDGWTLENALFQDSATPALKMRVAGVGGADFAGPAIGVNGVVTLIANGASSKAATDNNAYTTISTGTNTADGLTIGARQTKSNASNIKFFGGIWWSNGSSVLSDPNIASCRTFFGNLGGQTL